MERARAAAKILGGRALIEAERRADLAGPEIRIYSYIRESPGLLMFPVGYVADGLWRLEIAKLAALRFDTQASQKGI